MDTVAAATMDTVAAATMDTVAAATMDTVAAATMDTVTGRCAESAKMPATLVRARATACGGQFPAKDPSGDR
jgi:hypothetical protein